MVENDLTEAVYAARRGHPLGRGYTMAAGFMQDDSVRISPRVKYPVSALHACVTAANGVDHRTGFTSSNRC